jgi:D-glycero-alpha-D-manno-heptose-7-phosphate kinase
MFWTGHQRDSSSVLSEQKANTPSKMDSLLRMREHAFALQELCSSEDFSIEKFGAILDESWRLKRGLSSKISTGEIDRWYDAALAAGAAGGKLCGAGGGGFLLFIAKPDKHQAVREALAGLTQVPVVHEVHGSQVCTPFILH